jgi:hypothetical protein
MSAGFIIQYNNHLLCLKSNATGKWEFPMGPTASETKEAPIQTAIHGTFLSTGLRPCRDYRIQKGSHRIGRSLYWFATLTSHPDVIQLDTTRFETIVWMAPEMKRIPFYKIHPDVHEFKQRFSRSAVSLTKTGMRYSAPGSSGRPSVPQPKREQPTPLVSK